MRLGWMRLRCPTSAATPVLSRQSLVAPPAFPPIQANPSLSRLSSYSCATLICNMRLPGGDVLMKRARIGVCRKFLAQLAVAQHLCELGQYAQMLLGRLFRHQQQEHETHGLAVGRVERNRLCQTHKSPDCFLQTLDPAVRDSESLPQPRRAQTLAGKQAVEHQAPGHPLVVLEEQPSLLEHAFFARHIQVQEDVRRGQELGNEVHRDSENRPGRALAPAETVPRRPERRGILHYRLRGLLNALRAWKCQSDGGRCLSASCGCACKRSLCLMIWRSSLSAAGSVASYRSGSSLLTKMSLPGIWQLSPTLRH